MSQLQNGVSISSLPPFIVDLVTFKVYLRSNSIVQILEGVELPISQADHNAPKQQCTGFAVLHGQTDSVTWV